MKLPKPIKTKTCTDDQIKHLRSKRKMKRIGRGAFAEVFGTANCRRVVKIGNDMSDVYLKFVQVIGLRNRNPYFPKIYKFKMYKSRDRDSYVDKYYLAEIERLVKWNKVPRKIRNRLLNKFGCRYLEEAFDPIITSASGKHEKRAIHLLSKVWRSSYPDLHDGNVMFRRKGRGYQLVFTDPAC